MIQSANRFEAERIKRGLSLDDVVRETGVSKSLIWTLEQQTEDNIKRDIGYSKVVKLAKFYGVSMDYLLGLASLDDTTPIESLRAEREALKQELSKLRKAVSDMNKILETL